MNSDMKVVEGVVAAANIEPQWILARTGSGPLYWRRDSTQNNSRVKFRHDVEVKEFHRMDHETDDSEWAVRQENSPNLTIGMTCIFCIAITMMLPWYIFMRLQ